MAAWGSTDPDSAVHTPRTRGQLGTVCLPSFYWSANCEPRCYEKQAAAITAGRAAQSNMEGSAWSRTSAERVATWLIEAVVQMNF